MAVVKNTVDQILGIENKVFPIPIAALQYTGFWKSTNVSMSATKSFCYSIYTILSFVSVILLLVTIIIDNVISEKSLRDLVENMYLILVVASVFVKIMNVYFRQSNFIEIFQKLAEDRWSKARDDAETQIINESIYSERYIVKICTYAIVINGVSNALKPFIHPDPEHDLMVDAYTPCDRRSNRTCFWVSYVLQVFGYMCTSFIHLGCDNILYNSMERVCAYLRIFERRVVLLPELIRSEICKNEIQYFKDCIKDHQSILEVIKDLNKTFHEQVFTQFLTSISVMCTNIYLLSTVDLMSPDFVGVLAFLCCAMIQNFFHCWFGYKVLMGSLHVSDTLFGMDWWGLRRETKKMLRFVILKTSKRIYVCKNAIAVLTPEYFVTILKLSYSAFNILQQTS